MSYSIQHDPCPAVAKNMKQPLNPCCTNPHRVILHWTDPIDKRFGIQDTIECCCRSCGASIEIASGNYKRGFDSQDMREIAEYLTYGWNARFK